MLELLREYGKYVAVAAGLAAGFPLIWKRRERLRLTKVWQALALCAAFSALSTLSAVLFAALESLLRGQGVKLGAISTYGVYFLCPIPLLLLADRLGQERKELMDLFALYVPPSLFLVRINCLIAGCCGGRAIGTTGLTWPTREAEMVFYVVILAALLRREKLGRAPGTGFPLLMAAYGAFRFVEEWFREAEGPGLLHLAHGWSILACAVGLSLYFELSKNAKRGKSRHERSALKC